MILKNSSCWGQKTKEACGFLNINIYRISQISYIEMTQCVGMWYQNYPKKIVGQKKCLVKSKSQKF